MTYIESPTQSFTRFISTWRNTPPDRLSDEIVSAFNETHRKPDEYKFKFIDGHLVDYKTGTEIRIDTSTYLGKRDNELLDSLNYWASENSSGVAIWISPSYDAAYPSNKITIYTLKEENGEKTTVNVSVLFDTPQEHTLEIAAQINPFFINVNDPEVLRNKLFVMDDNFNLVSLLELIGEKQYFPETPSQQLINHFVYEIYSGKSPRDIAMEMERRGIVGEYSVSCGGGSTSTISLDGSSLTIDMNYGLEDKYGSLTFECPHCHNTNTRPFGQLISHCQHCGGDVRC